MAPDIFIGLVTHPGSRFPEARSANGLAAELGRELTARGLSIKTAVIDEDILDITSITLDPVSIRASLREEITVERMWREYISGSQASPALTLLLRARRVWNTLRLAPPWRRKLTPQDPGPRMVVRLANIELAHMSIFERGIDSKSEWILILEDDARVDDAAKLAAEIVEFISTINRVCPNLTMINLSESFSPSQLGIRHLVQQDKIHSRVWNIARAEKHVTNTVCAVLYRRGFLVRLYQELDTIPLEPVIPIDFKINKAILRAGKELPGETWVCSPAPILQGSGVPAIRVTVTR